MFIFSGSYCCKRDRLYSTYMQQLMMKHDACIISGKKSFNCFDRIARTILYLLLLCNFFQVHENLARVSESFICVRIEAIINFLLYTVLYTNMSLSVEYYAAVKLWIDAVKVSAKAVSCRSIIENFPSWSIIENGFSHLRLTRITQLQLRPALMAGITSRL